MTTDRFTVKEFETALASALKDEGLSFINKGVVAGEYRFKVTVKKLAQADIDIEIASSITASGVADSAGDNSIRLWLSSDGLPIGSKIQRWVTRIPGWQQRMKDQIERLVDMGNAVNFCKKCNSMEKIFIVKKDGPNKGRLFIRCNCVNKFEWLDETDQQPEPHVSDKATSPRCPDCGGSMKKRGSSRGDFWSCNLYPACRGTLNIDKDGNPTLEYVLRNGHKGVQNAKFDIVTGEPVAPRSILTAKPTFGQGLADNPEFNAQWTAMKNAAAAVERKQEEAAFMSDPVVQRLGNGWDEELAKMNAVDSAVTVKPVGFEASPQQEAIFTWVTKAFSVGDQMTLVVNAGAGTGKSTTLLEMVKRVPRHLNILIVAFNKHIKKAMAEKVKKAGLSNVRVSTFHGVGYGACVNAWHSEVVEDKVRLILNVLLDRDQYGYLFGHIGQIVSLIKNMAADGEKETIDEIILHHGLDVSNGDLEVVYNTVPAVLAADYGDVKSIDYDDMIWLPLMYNLPLPAFDLVLVDEAQDTNPAQMQLAEKCVRKNGKMIFVGDRYQSLYGFRGADPYAIPNIIARFNADELPLSVSYRCPRKVVENVNQLFPYIPFEAAPWAMDGAVDQMTAAVALKTFVDGDMVLCRTNAPLVKPAFSLIRQGRKAVIIGRDIGKGLKSLVEKMKEYDLINLLAKLNEYAEKEVTKLTAANKGSQASTLRDKVDTIVALSDGIYTVSELYDRIDSVFSEDAVGVSFSTVHKAKGLEANRIFIIHPELMPHPMARQPWEQDQERNIHYVARTRTLETLVVVSGDF